jgi:ABC-type antimicrobial peptide transport system permease subunit
MKRDLINLLLIQAFMFSIPGTLIGIILGYLLNSILCFFIFNYAGENTNYNLDNSALILGNYMFSRNFNFKNVKNTY